MPVRFFSKQMKQNRKWIKMTVDKMLFEANTDRYFLVLKAVGKSDGETVFLTIGNIMEENIISGIFGKNDNSLHFLKDLGISLKKIRILKKVNAPDSAECTFKVGLTRKKIKLSTLDAVRMATEFKMSIDVTDDLVKIDHFDLSGYIGMTEKLQDNIFSSKFIERDAYTAGEVIM